MRRAYTCRMRILVLDGHPDPESLTAWLAHRYASSAREAGHQIDHLPLRTLTFDTNLSRGYRERTNSSPIW